MYPGGKKWRTLGAVSERDARLWGSTGSYPGGCSGEETVFDRRADLLRHYEDVHASVHQIDPLPPATPLSDSSNEVLRLAPASAHGPNKTSKKLSLSDYKRAKAQKSGTHRATTPTPQISRHSNVNNKSSANAEDFQSLFPGVYLPPGEQREEDREEQWRQES